MVWQFLARIGLALLLNAVAAVLSPRDRNRGPQATGLDEFDIPTAEEGRPIPVLFGTVLVKGPNVVWSGDLDVDPIREKGGKK